MGDEKWGLGILREVYLPKFMTMKLRGYDDDEGLLFSCNSAEPQVTYHDGGYLTPRGVHVIVSQVSYLLLEKLIGKDDFFDRDTLDRIGSGGGLRITEIYQKFRREVASDEWINGKMSIKRFRGGKMPVIKFDFELAERAVEGRLTGLVVPKLVSQASYDAVLSRNNNNEMPVRD